MEILRIAATASLMLLMLYMRKYWNILEHSKQTISYIVSISKRHFHDMASLVVF